MRIPPRLKEMFRPGSIPGWILLAKSVFQWIWNRLGDLYNVLDTYSLLKQLKLSSVVAFIDHFSWAIGLVWLTAIAFWPSRKHSLSPLTLSGTGIVRNPPAASRLKIHSAFYGSGPQTDKSVVREIEHKIAGDRFSELVGPELFGDPAEGDPKRIVVEYSFDGAKIIKTERPQSKRLTLPEDPWLLSEIERAQTQLKTEREKSASVGSPVLVMEFPRGIDNLRMDDRDFWLLRNHGARPATSIRIQPIVIGDYRLEFDDINAIGPSGQGSNLVAIRYETRKVSDNSFWGSNRGGFHNPEHGLKTALESALHGLGEDILAPITIKYRDGDTERCVRQIIQYDALLNHINVSTQDC